MNATHAKPDRAAGHSTAPGRQDLLFQHAVLCQVYLPYRDPGITTTTWVRQQGSAYIAVQATKVIDPATGRLDRYIGLPFGPKARLVLTHINTLALQQRTPRIELAESLTSYVKSLGLESNGYQLKAIQNQLARLATCMITVAFTRQPRIIMQADSKIIRGFDIYFPEDDSQRLLWNNYIELSPDYFHSLMEHAVPLDRRHLGALSNNAMALDIYTWLAQRLHRIEPGQNEFIPWVSIKDQFGENTGKMSHFKDNFRHNLTLVRSQYQSARLLEEPLKGIYLQHSAPPIPPKTFSIPQIQGQQPGAGPS